MPKICQLESCKYPVFGKGFCKVHQYMRTDKKPSVPKTYKPIKKVSDKHKVELAVYSKLAKKFKEENPLCQAKLKNCQKITSDVHHKSGRGNNLNNVETWMPICRNCHTHLHSSMSAQEARDKGLIT